jgi:rod shape-determining protein MreC
MFVDYRYEKFRSIKGTLSLIVIPIQKVVDAPLSVSRNFGGFLATQKYLFSENKRLKQEQLVNMGRLQLLESLEKENRDLRELLQSGSEIANDMFIASIINIDPDPFTHQVIINKGKFHNVYQGQTMIDSNGVMGTVIGVNELESRAMLITDASHAVPVENVRNGMRAIAVGTGGANLELRHVPKSIDIAEGDMMITSGLGGRFPVGFPVGKVIDVKKDRGKPFATIVLEPSAKLDRGGHILLIRKGKANAE